MRMFWLGAVVMTSCATAPQVHEVEKYGTIHASPDATWSAVIALFGEKGWPIETIDKSSGLIATKWIASPAELADCGSAPLATILATKAKFNLVLQPQGEETRLVVNTTFEQVRSFADQTGVVQCTSVGRVEAGVRRDVEALVARSQSTQAATDDH